MAYCKEKLNGLLIKHPLTSAQYELFDDDVYNNNNELMLLFLLLFLLFCFSWITHLITKLRSLSVKH
jgi:hypothetical protein